MMVFVGPVSHSVFVCGCVFVFVWHSVYQIFRTCASEHQLLSPHLCPPQLHSICPQLWSIKFGINFTSNCQLIPQSQQHHAHRPIPTEILPKIWATKIPMVHTISNWCMGFMYIEINICAHFLLAPPGAFGGVVFLNVADSHLLCLRCLPPLPQIPYGDSIIPCSTSKSYLILILKGGYH